MPGGAARVVARVADWPFGPAGSRRAVLAAARAARGRPGRARQADRMVAGGEAAFPPPAAPAADGRRHLVAVHADVGAGAAGAHCDRGGLAAGPAPAMSPVMAAAPFTDALTGAAAADDRLDHAAVCADGREPTGSAPLACPALAAEQRHSGVAAARTGGRGERGRAAGDQLGGQPPGDRPPSRSACGPAASAPAMCHSACPVGARIDRCGHGQPRQRPFRRCRHVHDLIPAAAPAGGHVVAGRAAARPGNRAITAGRAAHGPAEGAAAATAPAGPGAARPLRPAPPGHQGRSAGCRTAQRAWPG